MDWRAWFLFLASPAYAISACAGWGAGGWFGAVIGVALAYLWTGLLIWFIGLPNSLSWSQWLKVPAFWLPALYSERVREWMTR